MSEIFAATI